MKNLKIIRLNRVVTLAIGVIVLLFIIFGIYLLLERNKEQLADIPPGWTQFKDSKYPFTFIHPEVWGKTTVTERKENKGKQFNIGFSWSQIKDTGIDKRTVAITLDTDDLELKVCSSNGNCISMPGLKASDIEKVLAASDKSGLAKYDSSSYTIVKTGVQAGLTSELNHYQIINLSDINVRTVSAVYSIFGTAADCPKGKLSEGSNNNCVNQSNYTDLVKVVKSLKPSD